MIFVLAKLVSLGVTAFVFEITRPKLLQLAWFRRLYEHVLVGLDWAHRLVDPIKRRIRALLRLFSPQRAGRTLRLFWRIRRRAARGSPSAQNRCTACGANRPIAMKADAEHAETGGQKVSATMPVITVADASTMPIWNAADATS